MCQLGGPALDLGASGVRRKAFTGEGATFAMNELQPHHEPRPHKHPFEQIAYIAAGVCDYHIEDQVFRLTPGGTAPPCGRRRSFSFSSQAII